MLNLFQYLDQLLQINRPYVNTDVAIRGLQEFRSRSYMNYDINCAASRERFLRQAFAECGRSYDNNKISNEKPYLDINDPGSRERYLRWLDNDIKS